MAEGIFESQEASSFDEMKKKKKKKRRNVWQDSIIMYCTGDVPAPHMSHHHYLNWVLFFSEDEKCVAKKIIPSNRESCHNYICQNNCNMIFFFFCRAALCVIVTYSVVYVTLVYNCHDNKLCCQYTAEKVLSIYILYPKK